MKVLCVGFPKTGTKSMYAALRELGYRVYDYEHNLYYLGKEWNKILTLGGTVEDFRKMYKDVDATVDIPACYFWQEIFEAFPDVKLVFMTRESEEKWLDSWKRQERNIVSNIPFKLLSIFSHTGARIALSSRHVGRVVFGSRSFLPWNFFGKISSTVAVKSYRDHNTCVKARAPEGQLLHFKLKDGWKPLCKFLDKPIPNKPFPYRNKKASSVQDYLDYSSVVQTEKSEVKFFFASLVAVTSVVYFFNFPNYVITFVFILCCLMPTFLVYLLS